MKCVYLMTVFLALAVVKAEEAYSTENDDFDIDALVKNTDELKEFLGCFMDTTSCKPIPADFKKDIPEAVVTSCKKCTAAQKHIFHTFLQALKEKLPSDYTAFKNKFDPEGTHFAGLEAAIASS